ncbi:kunitz type trypsin inhibitor 104-like [Curcuma longa]|uniref:kunitz type trypsin inhibitor 104-like n=1 Tax=Curcuma longa TaxID=136217 RepID=UPI003D9F0680
MKPTALLLLSFAAAAAAGAVVLDTEGNPLTPDAEYFINPAAIDLAGPLTLAARNDSCPLVVSLSPARSSTESGLPAIITPVRGDAAAVELLEDVTVVFDALTLCLQTTMWKIEFDRFGDGRFYVSTGTGDEGEPSAANRFKIRSAGGGDGDGDGGGQYELVFCPSACENCRRLCAGLGVYEEEGRQWLGIRDEEPFPFVFIKA